MNDGWEEEIDVIFPFFGDTRCSCLLNEVVSLYKDICL